MIKKSNNPVSVPLISSARQVLTRQQLRTVAGGAGGFDPIVPKDAGGVLGGGGGGNNNNG
jgi:hypothetical protein